MILNTSNIFTEALLEQAPLHVPIETRLPTAVKEHPYNCLIPGMRFSSYKELCIALMEPIKTGCAKEAQLKKWSVYFSWSKAGHKFQILEVHQTPLQWELIDRLTMRHIYKILLISTLYPLLKSSPFRQNIIGHPGQILGIELRKIFYWLGVVNEKGCEKFTQKKYGPVEQEFFTVLKAKNYAALISVIEELRHNYYLGTEHSYKIQIEGSFLPQITSAKQTAEIDGTIRKILDSYGCESVREIFLKKYSEGFYLKVQEELYSLNRIQYFEKCFNFTGVPESLYNYFYSLEGANVSLEVLLKFCQQQSSSRMKSHAEAKWKKFQETKDIFHEERSKNIELSENYLEQIAALIRRYIETVNFTEQELLQKPVTNLH